MAGLCMEKSQKLQYYNIVHVLLKEQLQHIIWATSWENLFISYVNNKGADQPAHSHSLISTFVVRCPFNIILLVSISSLRLPSVCGCAEHFWVYPGRKPRRQVFSWWGSYHMIADFSHSDCHRKFVIFQMEVTLFIAGKSKLYLSSFSFQDKEKSDQLNDLLNTYSVQGLPPPPSLIQIGQPHLDEKTFEVESDWRLIVDNYEVSKTRPTDIEPDIYSLYV